MIIGIIIIDQVIKYVIAKNLYNESINILDGILNFTYKENTGGAFSIGYGNVNIFIMISIVIFGVIIFLFKHIKQIYMFPLGVVFAGGVSNFLDRIFRGFVIDYIDFSPLIKYPIFNIADICIVVGCAIIIIDLIIDVIRECRVKNWRNK